MVCASTFCDKGQNSCYGADFFEAHSCQKIISYFSYVVCSKKQQSNIYLAVLDLTKDKFVMTRLGFNLEILNLGCPYTGRRQTENELNLV